MTDTNLPNLGEIEPPKSEPTKLNVPSESKVKVEESDDNCESGGPGDKFGEEGHMAKDCSEPSLDANGKPRSPLIKSPNLKENDKSLSDTASGVENNSPKDVPKDSERYETSEEAPNSETILNGVKESKVEKPTPILEDSIKIEMVIKEETSYDQTNFDSCDVMQCSVEPKQESKPSVLRQESDDNCESGGPGDKFGKEGHMAKDGSEPSLDAKDKPRSPILKSPDLNENDKSLSDTASGVKNTNSYDEIKCPVNGEEVSKDKERYETFEETSNNESLNDVKQSNVEKPTPIQEDGMKIEMAIKGEMSCDQTNFDSYDVMQCSVEPKQESKPSVLQQESGDTWGLTDGECPSEGAGSVAESSVKAENNVGDSWGLQSEPNDRGKSVDSGGGWGDPSPSETKPKSKSDDSRQASSDPWGAAVGECPSEGGGSGAESSVKAENNVGDSWGLQSEPNDRGKSVDSGGGWGDPTPIETKPKSKANDLRQGSDDAWEATGGSGGGWGDSTPSDTKPKPKSNESRQESGDTWGSSGSGGGWGDPTPTDTKPKSKANESRQESGDTWGSGGGWGDSTPSETTVKSNSNGSQQESGDTWASGGEWSSGAGGGSWGDAGSSSKKSGGSDWGTSSGKSGGSSGKGCFKCGEEGHMSRECPKGGGSGSRGKGCFKCGEEGHMSRECPSGGGSSRGGSGKGCFKCGEEGHMSRECPKGGGSGSRGKGCFKCGEEGHMSRECPSGGGSSRGGSGKGCFKCGEEGHMSRECPKGGRDIVRDRRAVKSEGAPWGSTGGDWGAGEDCAASPAKKNCNWDSFSGSNGSTAKKSSDDTWGSTGGGWGDPTPSDTKPKPKSNESRQESGDTWGSSGSGGGWGDPTPSDTKPKSNSNGSRQESGDTWGSGASTSWGDAGSSPKKSGGSDWGTSSGASDRGKSGGSGGKGCFKCGEEGHMSRECPKGGGSGSRGKGCHKCGKEGHMAKDCSEPSLDADGKPRPPIYKPPDLSENDASLFDTASAGENFDSYDGMPCSVSGVDVPKDPERYETFEEAFTSETILNGLKQSKIKKPTPIQKYGMRIVMAGRDLMACAQTGSGKTLAFILPILQDLFNDKDLRSGYGEIPSKPKALIISPTRELAVQIYKEAYKYSRGSIVKVQIIYGGTSVGHQKAKLSEGAHILVGTAGRLLDFLDKNYYDFSELKYLVLDEADRMIDQGFIPDVRKMIIHPTMPPKEKRQTLMFSATFPNAVQKVAGEFLVSNYLFLTVGILGAANSDVHQTLLKVEKFSKRNKLIEILKESDNNDRTMIFVESKKTADFLASFLSQSDYRATSIHGDRYQRQREEALDDLKSGKFPILVATSVASRGLDIKDVRHVINYDLPKEIDDYIHRIGRTGRVGNKGKATSFYDPDADKALAAKIVEVIESASQPVPDWLKEETSEGQFGNGIAFGGIDYRGRESETSSYQDLDAPKSQSTFDLEW